MSSKCKFCSNGVLEFSYELLRHVCNTCGSVSEETSQMIQHEVDAPTSTYGLKCVGTVDYHSAPNVTVLKPSSSQVIEERREYKGESGSQPPQYDSGGQTGVIPRTGLRNWRVSEAFSALLRLQLKYIIEKHLPHQSDFSTRLREMTKKLWINYLSVTGELGGDLWAVAFRRVVHAIQLEQKSRLAFLFHRASEYKDGHARLIRLFGRNNELFSSNVLSSLKEKMGPEPYYAGWSGFYKPTENDAANNPFSAFDSDKENEESFAYLEDVETDADSSYSDIEKFGRSNNSSRPPTRISERTRRRRGNNAEVQSRSSSSSSSSSVSHAPRKRSRQRTSRSSGSGSDSGANAPLAASEKLLAEANDLPELAKLYETLITNKLLVGKNARRNMFWHGQMAKDSHYRLLEFNLGLIYLASLLTSTVHIKKPGAVRGEGMSSESSSKRETCVRRKRGCSYKIERFQLPAEIAVCKGDLFTLSDLSALCLDRDNFPYFQASKWITPPFVFYNSILQAYFKRVMKPDPHDLCLVVKQLIFMLGITTRPKLPICPLVHRYLRLLNLPPEAHRLADTLLRKLAFATAKKTKGKLEEGGFYLLSLERYLRPEVFAMGVITVAVRLLLKLDGKFEKCWSDVAKYLTANPAVSQRLTEVLHRGKSACAEGHFDWSTWVCELPNEGAGMREHRRRFRKGDAALGTAMSFEQVIRTARTTEEFLGSHATFDLEKDVGWGEIHGKNSAIANKGVKIALTKELMNLIGDMSSGDTMANADDAKPSSPEPGARRLPCRSCRHFAENAIFSRSEQATCTKWLTSGCDSLVAAHEFIRQNGITASDFLERVMPPDSKQPSKRTHRNWLYILEHFDAYEPISKAVLRRHQQKYSTKLPEAVRDFLDLHNQRMTAFLAGKPVDRDPIPAPEASREAPAEDDSHSASLHWFLDAAATICEARPFILLREIQCVESLLNLCPTSHMDIQTENHDIVLTSHFDFSLPN